jgi:hypothetical protein
MTLLSLLLSTAEAGEPPRRSDYDVVLSLFGEAPSRCGYPGPQPEVVPGRLVGTVVSDLPAYSSAWVLAQGQSAGYGLGDFIPGSGRVVGIEADGVLVEREGESMVLVP